MFLAPGETDLQNLEDIWFHAVHAMQCAEWIGTDARAASTPMPDAILLPGQMAVLQLHLVTAIRAGAYERVSSFFSAYGERLLQGQGAETWSKWFALPYLSQEAAQAQFQVLIICLHESIIINVSFSLSCLVRSLLHEIRSCSIHSILRHVCRECDHLLLMFDSNQQSCSWRTEAASSSASLLRRLTACRAQI